MGALALLQVVAFWGTAALLPWPLQKKGSHLLRSPCKQGRHCLAQGWWDVASWCLSFCKAELLQAFSNAGKMLPPCGPHCHRCLPGELGLLFPYPEEQQGQRWWLLLVHQYSQLPLLLILSRLAAVGLVFHCGSRGKRAMEIFLTPGSFLCCLCLKPGMDFHWTWKGFVQKRGGQVEMFQIKMKQPALIPPPPPPRLKHQEEISLAAFRIWEALKWYCRELQMRLEIVLITGISYWWDPFLVLQILSVSGGGTSVQAGLYHSSSCFEMRMWNTFGLG